MYIVCMYLHKKYNPLNYVTHKISYSLGKNGPKSVALFGIKKVGTAYMHTFMLCRITFHKKKKLEAHKMLIE